LAYAQATWPVYAAFSLTRIGCLALHREQFSSLLFFECVRVRVSDSDEGESLLRCRFLRNILPKRNLTQHDA
jgi:hypothetical protein